MKSSFRAAATVSFDPDQFLSKLGPVIASTASLQGSESLWDPNTLKTLPKIKKLTNLTLDENLKSRRSSVSSSDKPFHQLLKGFVAAAYQSALLEVECAALRAENQD